MTNREKALVWQACKNASNKVNFAGEVDLGLLENSRNLSVSIALEKLAVSLCVYWLDQEKNPYE